MSVSQGRPVRIVSQPSVDMVKVYVGPLTKDQAFVVVEAERTTMACQVRNMAVTKLRLGNTEDYELSEIVVSDGQLCKERRLEPEEHPVQTQIMWPKMINSDVDQERGVISGYRFYIRKKDSDSLSRTPSWAEKNVVTNFLTSFLRQSTSNKEYTDLCNLPDLNEQTLLENIRTRFNSGNIYTYVGEILIAVNPFKFFPIYNPTYVKMYQNKRLGELPPHIFAIADAAFHKMLRTRQNQCIVISGESGSGKTESTNLLLHHLTALSQKGIHASGVEQTILGAGPVLEAFGNAKTVHNNNSSRFGKFIQVNYKENGMVHGALVEKYLLEKSRIVAQARDERNYHVFYYLLAGAGKKEVDDLHLYPPDKYYYLKQSECFTLDGVDEVHEFARLQESMELVGFTGEAQKRIFCVLSAVLHLGNVEFRKKGDQSYDESVIVKNDATITIISNLLKVKEKTLLEALTQKRTIAGEETLVMNNKMEEAIATRDAMAKCLYGALFDWIVLKVNHALLAKRHHSEHQGNSIGVLDIFGFEDFMKNSFEQFCINYANEHLQYYFNQHIFKLEQEEYRKEGIEWKNIEFIDNTGCLELFSKRGGLFFQLDEECNFPAGTNESLLEKYHQQHRSSSYYSAPQLREQAFCIEHYAGKVKYDITDFREKNNDLVRMDIVGVLKNSSLVFVRELMGVDPVAVLRWAILRAVFKSLFAFKDSGKMYQARGGKKPNRRSLYLPSSGYGDSIDEETTEESLCDQINEEALVILSQQPNLTRAESRVIRKASKVLLKNKPVKLKSRHHRSFHDIQALKSIASRAKFTSGKLTSKKAPPSVSTQFQWSLSRLLQALNQADPFFIRCIKSNSEKAPCKFDDTIVLRQLRYTGMLATVKIRQSGYNYRLTFDEFSQMYKILLPHGVLSSRNEIQRFLEQRDLHRDNYQVGKTKVFLREADKILLDEGLHNAIMERVVRIQRWMKTLVQRQRFLAIQTAVHETQRLSRGFLVRRRVESIKGAVLDIQCLVRGYIQRKKYATILVSVHLIQSMVRAFLTRKRYRAMLAEKRRLQEEEDQRKKESSTSDKGSSAEELDIDREDTKRSRLDSDRVSALREGFKEKQISDTTETGQKLAKPRTAKKKGSLSLTKLEAIEAALKNHQAKEGETSPEKPSPQRPKLNIRQKIHNFIGPNRAKLKKEQSLDDSDDEQLTPKKRPQDLGVQVLPILNTSPVSPRKNQESVPIISPLPIKRPNRHKKQKKAVRKQEELKANRETRGPPGNWSLSATSQWQYDINLVISDIQELQQLDEFLHKKMKELNKDQGKRDTIFDVVFKKAIRDFHMEMKSLCSLAMQEGYVHVKYRDLMTKFENIVMSQAKKENTKATFPVTMGINAFRVFLDEFMKEVKKKDKKDPKKVELRVEKKEKNKKEFIDHLNHRFQFVQFNIPTFCESCNVLMWIMEKILVCQYCRYTCHKRCYNKSIIPCKGTSNMDKNQSRKDLFGGPIDCFTKDSYGWMVLERLINTIETQGLYIEGIYRKSGAAQKIKQLRQAIIEDGDSVDFEEYNIHVLTTMLKTLFREMPEPLLTFELYDDFIKAAEVGDEKDKLQGLYAVADKLPKQNHDLFERLVFHLARVAQHEESNKMSPNGLAIVFAPCLMWTSKKLQAQVSLDLVPKQTMVIEYIVSKQLDNLMTTLEDISTLESVTATAAHRLSVVQNVIRASIRLPKDNLQGVKEETGSPLPVLEEDELDVTAAQVEVKVLSEHIHSLTRQKNTLTCNLPTLELRHVSTSDEEFLSVDDAESTLDSIDDDNEPYEEYAVTFDLPVTPPQLQHLNKGRAALPPRHLPKRYEAAVRLAKDNERENFYRDMMQLESPYLVRPQNISTTRGDHAEILV